MHLQQALRSGCRNALRRAITIVESTKPEHERDALTILDQCYQDQHNQALRIGLTGTPGVGKSSFVESFGSYLLEHTNSSLAVITIDPSSPVKGGSILGDRTRMNSLSNHPRAYIRSSPNKCQTGGIAPRTNDVISLCEYAGFDYIFIETVGIGQSDIDVLQVSDIVALLLQPGGGDELQGIKRGLLEMIDMMLVTKSDGNMTDLARETMRSFKNSGHILGTTSSFFTHSSYDNMGNEDILQWIQQQNINDMNRQQQREYWIDQYAREFWQKKYKKVDNSNFESNLSCRSIATKCSNDQQRLELVL